LVVHGCCGRGREVHIVGIQLLGITSLPGSPPHVLFGFIVTVTTFAIALSRYVSRGPMEWLMTKATGIARHVQQTERHT